LWRAIKLQNTLNQRNYLPKSHIFTKKKQMHKFFSVALLAIFALSRCEKPAVPGEMTEIQNFGSNPGNLKCYQYIPDRMPRKAPLVVVLHGCLQDAQEMARLSGWNELAEREKFAVIYPQQQASNNVNRCFNWFNPEDIARDGGEAQSIQQMVLQMLSAHQLDQRRVFITGVSAGGAMTLVMAAAYPETFSASAAMAAVPYGAASDIPGGMLAMSGQVVLSAESWGEKVRSANPNYKGAYPRLAIFHGTDDQIVKIANANEIVKQWSDVHRLGNAAGTATLQFNNNPYVSSTSWKLQNKDVIVRYDISGLGHAIPVDPGTGPRQGGQTAVFARDMDFHAAWWSANFFNILRN
jgi:poly(hydroxyalkanoate) depolymerase family esterase